MEMISKILIALVMVEHFYIMWLEMFAWETVGKKTFKGAMPDDMFSKTKTMAANQGLYNGFLAMGLLWSFFVSDALWSKNIAMFFLLCVILAGIYGAYSVSKKIFITQSVPAILALVITLLCR